MWLGCEIIKLIKANASVINRLMRTISVSSKKGVVITITCLLLSGCDFRAWPPQLLNWQEDPKACANFWDTHFSKILEGDDNSAEILFYAINTSHLIPPGRDKDNYTYKNQLKDLEFLAQFLVHPYERLTGNSLASNWMYNHHDFPMDTSLVFYDYFPRPLKGPYAVSQVFGEPGLCSIRSGIMDPTTDEWAMACRKILVADGVLPSVDEFLSTIPANARACNYKGDEK